MSSASSTSTAKKRSSKLGHPDLPVIIRSAQAGDFTRVSRLFLEQMGLDSDELKAKPLTEWIHPDDRSSLQTFLEAGEGSLTARHRTQSGEWIDFDWKTRHHEGQSVVMGVLHAPTDQSNTEPSVEPEPRPSTMHEILEEMARIIEDERPGLKCSVLLLNEDRTRIVGGAGPSLPQEYNKAVEGLLIGPEVGSCGTAAYWNERVIVEDIQSDPLWRNLKKIAAQAGVASCWSHPITTKSGRVLGATALYSPTPRVPTQQELDGLGSAARMFGLAIEHAYAEEALEKAKAARQKRESELEDQLHQAAKMEALGVLAGGVAHDFNNMLVSILGNAEMAMKTVPSESETHLMLRDIITASRSASELCSQMLAYAGRGVMSKQKLECNELLTELGSLLQVAISKKAVLDYALSSEPLYVDGDKAQLVQVFMNLITNASESFNNSTGRILTRTGLKQYTSDELAGFQIGSARTEGSYAWFQVADTGSGMSPETVAKLFDPFFTTKFTGRGLGMAAVRGIVLRHKGHIRIESELGKGTTFTVLLPSVNAPSASDWNGSSPNEPDRPKRVMVVDDEDQVRRTLARVLRSSGFDALQAENGKRAIELFQEHRDSIDCVLLDLSMPDLDGEETFRELKKIDPQVKVILNSGYAEEDILNRIDGAGFAGLLHKPTPSDILIAKLQEVTS